MKKDRLIRLIILYAAGMIIILSACEKIYDDEIYDLQNSSSKSLSGQKGNSMSDAKKIEEFTYYPNLVVASGSDNWYLLEISADSIVITCEFQHEEGDINIELLDHTGTVLDSSVSVTNYEIITHIVSDIDHEYYIRVYLKSGINNTYTLWWDDIMSGSYQEPPSDPDVPIENNHTMATAAPINEYHYYENLTITDTEDDWYAITVSADSIVITCDFVHENGDLNIELVDKDGVVLASSSGITDHEEIIHIISALETYYIHVYMESGRNNTYTLWWDDIWAE